MNRFKAAAVAATLGMVAILFVLTSMAQASGTRWAWTESKARQIVSQTATVRVPAPLRASLATELLAAVRLYSALEMAAVEVGDTDALATFQSLGVRYRQALKTLQRGLAIEAGECTGVGAPLKGKRFTRFRCVVTSMPLEIPSAHLDYGGDGELPQVIESEPRLEGPFKALLDVRVVGRSAIAYRALS